MDGQIISQGSSLLANTSSDIIDEVIQTLIMFLLVIQISQINRSYAELEKKLVEMRQKSKSEVTLFLDDEIGTILNKLSRQVARIDSRLFTYHEVDVASGYKDTEKLIDELMKIQIPRYKPSSNHVCCAVSVSLLAQVKLESNKLLQMISQYFPYHEVGRILFKQSEFLPLYVVPAHFMFPSSHRKMKVKLKHL